MSEAELQQNPLPYQQHEQEIAARALVDLATNPSETVETPAPIQESLPVDTTPTLEDFNRSPNATKAKPVEIPASDIAESMGTVLAFTRKLTDHLMDSREKGIRDAA